MRVTHLFLKGAPRQEMQPVPQLSFTTNGLLNNVPCQPLRQVLISSSPIAEECGLQPGDLRENISVDDPNLYQLKSGAVVKIGQARIRLTFHCEPCKGILSKIKIRDILHKRGVLGYFLNSDVVKLGDKFSVADEKYEAIPYDVKERVQWYLAQQNAPVTAVKLVYEIGLAKSYVRALPALLRRMPDIDPACITFQNQQRTSGEYDGHHYQ